MSRRQREGRGGRDFHGCGNAGCFYCGNRRQFDGETAEERAADIELEEDAKSFEVRFPPGGWVSREDMVRMGRD